MSKQLTDKELVKRVKQGDRSAFDLLVRKHQHKVANLVGRYIKDQAEVYDVVQEVFLKAYRGMDKFRGESAFYTWLYRIAVNTAKNYLASRSRRSAEYEVDADEAEQYGGESALKEYATPEREILTQEIKETVIKAIEELPEDLRTAITLREIDGLSYEEIAEVMDCPIGTVRSRIFRAREAIDKQLKPLLK